MSVNDPRIDVLRARWNAMQVRKVRAYANANGSYLGSSNVAYPFRFTLFINKLERYQSAGRRFRVHTARVDFALLSPITRYLLEVA